MDEFVIGKERLDPIKWPGVVKAAREWADEIVQPDLWDDLVKNEKFRTGALYDDLENSPFSADEQSEISDQLREIKGYLKEAYSLSDEQMSRIETRLDEAEKASHRMGRKDWLLLFSGTIFTLIVTDLIPPDVAQHAFTLTVHGLNHLFATKPHRINP